MKFKDAGLVIVSFGKYRGSMIRKIAETNDGLRYLDWLAGQDLKNFETVANALNVYLSDSTITKELERLVS